MFGQLFSARLKTAEKAFREGRLDDAFRLASAPDLREHKRGKALLAELSKPFFERAREHFHEDRFAEALADLQRARTGGVDIEEIDELQSHVEVVAAEAHRRHATHKARVDAARQRIEKGSLAAGRDLLERITDDDHDVARLKAQIEDRAEDMDRIVQQARQLLKRGQLAAAADRVRRAKSIEAHDARVTAMESDLCKAALNAARAALNDGKIARASDELGCLGSVGDDDPAKKEILHILSGCREATAAFIRHDYPEARRALLAVQRNLPKGKWLRESLSQLDRIDELQIAIAAGPLGAARQAQPPAAHDRQPAMRSRSLEDTLVLPGRSAGSALPSRLLLLVDGGGSFLLLRNPQMSVGRAACDNPADVAILSDIAERHANLTRVDDDYFLFASKDVEVAGRQTRQKLLGDGERVVLGPKAKFTFRVPSRKSATAVLDLSDTTKMPRDVRRVLAFDRHAVIGQGATAHIVCRHASPPLVLFERDDAMWVRRKNDGHVATAAQRLEMGVPLEIDGINLVLEPWHHRHPGTSTV